MRRIEAEGRPATPEEQAQLAKFTGWGASEIRQGLFPPGSDREVNGERVLTPRFHGPWKETSERAAQILRGRDLETALRSTQYAHYTSEAVVRSIWQGMERLGFAGGKIFEPGMGIGLFPVAAPQGIMAKSSYTGIELDEFTARVGKLLLPGQNVIAGDFTRQSFPDGFFDVAIGNPPFADIRITSDPAYKRHRFSLHDYFFAKSIDKVRPGGLLAFVTSRYTMDKLDNKARAYMAERANLLGAIRLPQTAFQQNAGTEVVTDVLFFQRRAPGETPAGELWMGNAEISDAQGQRHLVNEYFATHPEMVLGTHSSTGSMYRSNEYTVLPPDGDIEAAFARAVERLPEGVYASAPAKAVAARAEIAVARDFDIKGRKEGGVYVKDGALMVVENGSGVPLASTVKTLRPAEVAWLTDYVGLRDALKQAQLDQLQDGDWKASLAALRKAYQAFVKKHGPIQAYTAVETTREKVADEDTPGAVRKGDEWVVPVSTVSRRLKHERKLRMDIEGPLVSALESIDADGNIVEGSFLKDRVLGKRVEPVIETVQDALGVSLDQIGGFDLGHVAALAKVDPDTVIKELGTAIYEAPGTGWQMADEYLSGNVRDKLREAEIAAGTDPRFQRNVEALRKVQPAPLGTEDIDVRLGAAWVHPDIISDFASEIIGVTTGVQYHAPTGQWAVDAASGSGSRWSRRAGDWGTEERSPAEILEGVLNGRKMDVAVYVGSGKDKRRDDERSKAATAAVADKAQKMKDAFKRWLWTSPDRVDTLTTEYNERFNNIAPRHFDGSHLTLPGLSLKYKLYDHQKRAIWRIIQSGDTYLAHAVGAGKTLEMIVSAMEQRRLGLVRKPMFVVPNHMLDQFAGEFLDAYPTANIMVASEKAFHTDNRRRFMAQAALNDLDAIIVTHSSFGKLSPNEESRRRVLDDMIAEMQAAVDEMGKDQSARQTRKKLESQIERLEQRFSGKASTAGKDNALTFEEMGVDFLYVDEAHEFRKLDYATQRQVKGIDPVGSARALDLFIKIRALETQRPGRAVVLASGTPITNTMAELYTVQRLMDWGGLERDGLSSFDAWASMFGEEQSKLEPNAAGTYEMVTRFRKFTNVPELMNRVRSKMDVLVSSQLGHLVKRPDVKTGGPQLEITPIVPDLGDYMQGELQARITASRNWKPSPGELSNPDPMIAIIGAARLSAIDMRFVNPDLPSDPNSKLNRMIDKIAELHKASAGIQYPDGKGGKQLKRGGTQIVFSPLGFGDAVARRGFDARAWMVRRLREQGVRPDEIIFMGDLNTHAKKEAAFKDMRSGVKRILIGSPANMGTGVNVQSRLYALHYLAPPWYPADVEQPHGRIIRQGNLNPEVEIYWYATKGTYDSTGWGMVSSKASMIEQAMIGNAQVRTVEDISEVSQYDMASALAAGDERVIEMSNLKADVEQLTRVSAQHETDRRNAESRARGLRNIVKSTTARMGALQKAADSVRRAGSFGFMVDGGSFERPGEAGDAMLALIDRAATAVKAEAAKGSAASRTIGDKVSFAGHPVEIQVQAMGMGPRAGQAEATISLSVEGHVVTPLQYSDVEGLNGLGLAQRIANAFNRIPSELADTERMIAEQKAEIKRLEALAATPFDRQSELNEKTAALATIEQELATEAEAERRAQDARHRARAAEAPEGEGSERLAISRDSADAMALDDAAIARIEAALAERFDELGLGRHLALRISQGLRSMQTGEAMEGVDGSYFRNVIQVAYGATDAVWTLNHEAVHALRDMGLFKPSEWTALEKAALADTARMAEIRERYRDQGLSESELIEEAVADMFADWHGGQERRGFIRTAFERVRGFLRAVYSALTGEGYVTADDVFAAIDRGDVAVRGGVQARADARPRRQQRRDGDGDADAEAAANILFELQDVDELFRYPVSEAHTPGEALRDMDPTITEVGDTADLADRDGYPFDRRLLFRTAAGADFFVYENDGEVWIDVSALQEGEGGSAIYAAIADYAFNRKKQFIGDPAGLSDVALRRRTDAMLSSAIKHGTTDHIAPHPRQLEGSEALGIPPLRWRAGDTVGNVSRMIEVSIASTLQAVPDIGDARYDFDSGTFRTGEGQPITDGTLGRWRLSARGAGASGIGRQTLRRSILLSTLAHGTGEERSRLLERILLQPDQLVSGEARKTFYSIRRERTDTGGATPSAPARKVRFTNAETEARWQDASRGVAGTAGSLIQRVRDWGTFIAHGFTRHYKHLPSEPRYSDVMQQLRKLEAAPTHAKEEMVRHLREITAGMDPDAYDLFTRKVVLDDLAWEASQGHDLPFGLTDKTLPAERRKVNAAIKADPALVDAVRRRKLLVKRISDQLVASGVLRKEQVANPAYFRHQVLEYARAEKRAAASNSKLRSPVWARREGSTLDINANLLEAEADWMLKALTDIAAADTIDWIKKSNHNIRANLLSQARSHNDAGVQDAIRQDIADNGFLQGQRMTSPLDQEWRGIRQKMAMGFDRVKEALKSGALVPPAEHRAAARALQTGNKGESVFPFLEWILETDAEGAMGAGMVMKSLAQRRAFMKDVLKADYANPHDIEGLIKRFAPEGYVSWQPDEGRLLFTAKTIPEHVIDGMMVKIADEAVAGISRAEMQAALGQLKDALVLGGDKFKLVIPAELADTLNSLRDEHAETLLTALLEVPLAWWKRWVLINPRRVLKYNLNNMSGDLDAVIAGSPRAVRRMPEAIRELYAVQFRGAKPSQKYLDALQRGVFDSGLSINEIPDINKLSEFDRLLSQPRTTSERAQYFMLTPFAKIWRVLNDYTQFRENWARYAAYLDYIDRIEAGEDMKKIGYGAARPAMVDAITDNKDKAALLARELVGDYGNVSAWGEGIRRSIIPFWSWVEINTKRYSRLFLNAWNQGVGQGLTATGVMGAKAGIAGVRTTAWLTLRMGVVYGAVQLWNNLFFGDEEEELSPEDRARMHLLLGKGDDGRVRMIRLQGAMSDYLGWFGFEDAIAAAVAMEKGRAGLGDILEAIAKAPVNRLLNGLTPVLTVPVESLSGKKFWPDVFTPRQIRDGWRNLASTFSLENEYDLIAGKPSRGYLGSWVQAIVTSRDEGEAAYNRVRGLSYDWLRRETGEGSPSFAITPASQAMYEWRTAKRFGDKKAETRAYDRMLELGVTGPRIRASIKRADPLGHMTRRERSRFLQTLDERERKALDLANDWYRETFLSAG